MTKLVVFKLYGTLEQGLQVRLEIGEDGQRPFTEVRGELSRNLELSKICEYWRTQYQSEGRNFRKLSARDGQVTHISYKVSSQEIITKLGQNINRWLEFEGFRPVKEKLLQKLDDSEEIRVLLQTEDIRLKRMPWHLWNFFDKYSKAELALSPLEYDRAEQNISSREPKEKIKILAILGNSEGIDIELDRKLLENLENVDVTFLIEPHRQILNNSLWEQNWDILFFAGHSQTEEKKGRIFINKTESLNIEELKFSLRKAIANGLHLAIFNSCDGLGLAFELSELYIPQMIIMREPVPDLVAQEFLKNFLSIFSSGESLYISVREAREKLQWMESEFSCATFLPVIFQNPAILPSTWFELCSRPETSLSINHELSKSSLQLEQVIKQKNNREKLGLKNKFQGQAHVAEKIIPPGRIGCVRFRGALWRARNNSETAFYENDLACVAGRENLTLLIH